MSKIIEINNKLNELIKNNIKNKNNIELKLLEINKKVKENKYQDEKQLQNDYTHWIIENQKDFSDISNILNKIDSFFNQNILKLPSNYKCPICQYQMNSVNEMLKHIDVFNNIIIRIVILNKLMIVIILIILIMNVKVMYLIVY